MAERAQGMFRHYWHLLPEVLRVFQSTVRTVIFWVSTVLVTVAIALNQHWASRVDLKAFPPWVALLLLGAAFIFALMRASYRQFEAKPVRSSGEPVVSEPFPVTMGEEITWSVPPQ